MTKYLDRRNAHDNFRKAIERDLVVIREEQGYSIISSFLEPEEIIETRHDLGKTGEAFDLVFE
jgi:hypothetical protein